MGQVIGINGEVIEPDVPRRPPKRKVLAIMVMYEVAVMEDDAKKRRFKEYIKRGGLCEKH